MRKIIKIVLINLLTFNFILTSFASDDKPIKEGADQKAGEKIIITESVEPVAKPEENAKETEKVQENKTNPKEEQAKTDDPKTNKDSQNNKEDSAYRAKKTAPAESKDPKTSETKSPEMERLEKQVDDLVMKLDKNSNLSKALAEMQKSINTEKKASVKSKDVSEETEAVLKDYNKKLQNVSDESERKKLENETARKIQSISENNDVGDGVDSSELSPAENIPEKKKKILLEVKPDKEDKDDRSQILALNPNDDGVEEDKFFLKNPIVIIASIFVIAIVVVIGIVIRKNDIKGNIDDF